MDQTISDLLDSKESTGSSTSAVGGAPALCILHCSDDACSPESLVQLVHHEWAKDSCALKRVLLVPALPAMP